MVKRKKPSPLESQILAVLWQQPGTTVREVNAALKDGKERAYTTVLTALQVMERKGLATRERKGVTDHWSATVSESEVARPLLSDLVQGLFSGRRQLALHYLFEDGKLTAEEIAEMQKLIKQARKEDS